jgi:hypothetical protein
MKKRSRASEGRSAKRKHVAHAMEGLLAELLQVRLRGAIAGPVGSVAGASLGGAAGAVVESILDARRRRRARGARSWTTR